ncbi:MAG: S1 family peptidase [Bacteroidetes bacterium]|nr:S1 family peptidase [Bacteroidota bacterium]
MNQSELFARQNLISSRLETAKETLSQYPNVVAVGIGFKETGKKFTDELSLRVFVTRKKDLSALSAKDIIPDEINGIKTDVLNPLVVTNDSDVCGTERRTLAHHRPLKAGIAISTDSDSYGTLGWFGKLDVDDTPVLLTNKHVLYDSTIGTDSRHLPTAQPQVGSPSKCCCCECGSDNVIGESIIGIKDTNPFTSTSVDCAIAKINPEFASNIQLHITNSATDEVLNVSGTGQAVVGQHVRKIGARSGYTRGVVVHIGDIAVAAPQDSGGTDIDVREGQVLIIPEDDETYEVKEGVCKRAFSNSGDSGAVILNEDDEIIALNWGGDRTTNVVGITIASNIANVLQQLSDLGFPISLSVSPSGGDVDRHKATRTRSSAIADPHNVLLLLKEHNPDSLLHHLFDEHHREILALINHARPVMVAWQRHQGPAFVAAIARAAREEHYRIPEEINGVSRTRLLLAMKEALILSGSAALQQDIVRYESAILKSVAQGDTIRALAEKLLAAGLIDHIPTHLSTAIA